MTDSKYDGAPVNPFGDLELPSDVDTEVVSEMVGLLSIDDNHNATFVSAQGPSFPALLPEGLAVSATIVDGVAAVASVIVDDVTDAAITDQAVTDTAIDLIDEHMGELAKWLVTNMPGEIERMSPSETMVELVIRLLAATQPPIESFNRNTKALMESQEAKRRRIRGG